MNGGSARQSMTVITARKRSLGQGNIFTPVCHSVHRGGVRGCSGREGGVRGCSGGHVWLLWGGMCGSSRGGMHGCSGGACVVALGGGASMVAWGGMCGFIWGDVHGFIQGGMRGFIWGGVRGFFSFFGYNEIRSMSGRYASYWNAFLLVRVACLRLPKNQSKPLLYL